jgi:hypothetical protein
MEAFTAFIKNGGPTIGFGLAFIAFLVLWWTAAEKENADAARVRRLFLLFGAILGWIVGILITPEKAQQDAFAAYGTAITTFVTGFLVAKIDRVFEAKMQNSASFVNEEFILRTLLGGAAFGLGVLCTFIWRSYVSGVVGT